MPSAGDPGDDEFVAIADAADLVGMTRRDLLRRLRLGQVEDLRYVPAQGGWFIPRWLLQEIAESP